MTTTTRYLEASKLPWTNERDKVWFIKLHNQIIKKREYDKKYYPIRKMRRAEKLKRERAEREADPEKAYRHMCRGMWANGWRNPTEMEELEQMIKMIS